MKFLSGIRNPNTRMAVVTGGIVVGMVGASFAAVPFYRWFCQVTGYGGKPAVSAVAPDDILDQTIRVRFER